MLLYVACPPQRVINPKLVEAVLYMSPSMSPMFPSEWAQIEVGVGAQTLYERLIKKVRCLEKDNHFNEELRRLRELHAPTPNYWPTSYYVCKKLVDCMEAQDVELHVCKNDCHVFPPLRKAEFTAHEKDECPTCHEPRFVHEVKNGKECLVPQKVFWSFDIQDVIADEMFGDPEFCRLRGSGRSDGQDYYNSEECKRLYKQAFGTEWEQQWRNRTMSIYDIGLDWFEPFNKAYSVGIVTLR